MKLILRFTSTNILKINIITNILPLFHIKVMKIVNMASSITYMVYAVKTVICPICPGMTMVRNMIAI